jgi:hypothetical protein
LSQGRIEIVPVETRAQWRAFHRVPYRVYAGDPNWVAPLLIERRMHVSSKHNPYFQHAEAAFWIALRDGEPVGRISAQIDRLHLERHKDATGQFGFIEGLEDPEIFVELLRAAEAWLRARGMVRAVGPLSFSLWHEAGLMVEGFDTPPVVMMGHARPYFASSIEAAGYRPVQDLIAYDCNTNTALPPATQRIVDRARTNLGVTVRPCRMDKRNFPAEVAIIRDILNDAWSDNWGFVPMTHAEIDDLARLLKLLLKPDDVSIAEYQGEPAAFAITFPNINEAIRDLGGRLAPFGWMKALWRLKMGSLRTARMPLMGVRKIYQDSTIGAALAMATIHASIRANVGRGFRQGELSWVLEQNKRVRHVIEWLGAVPYKRYRIYERHL